MPEFQQHAFEKFCGCDSDELAAGSPSKPAIWLFGIEHGTYKSVHDNREGVIEEGDKSYSIDIQMKWSYNQKAFKLLAAIYSYPVKKFREFAHKYQPFVKGSSGFFKGNIYPYPCHNEKSWPEKAKRITGFQSKVDYQKWCREFRLPVIRSWIEEYQPKAMICVGLGFAEDFAIATFGKKVEFKEYKFSVNDKNKRILYIKAENKTLVVLPHLSSPSGLNSNKSLEIAGKFVAKLIG